MTSSQVVSLLAFVLIGLITLSAAQNTTNTANSTSSRNCGALSDPDNGGVSVVTDTATYTCNEGFTLSGSETRSCVEGVWDGTAPTCQPNPTSGSSGNASAEPSPKPESTPEPSPEPTYSNAGSNEAQNQGMGKGSKGLRGDQIALAVIATVLTVLAIAFFAGLAYWKFYGTSYVTVSADTTYLK